MSDEQDRNTGRKMGELRMKEEELTRHQQRAEGLLQKIESGRNILRSILSGESRDTIYQRHHLADSYPPPLDPSEAIRTAILHFQSSCNDISDTANAIMQLNEEITNLKSTLGL